MSAAPAGREAPTTSPDLAQLADLYARYSYGVDTKHPGVLADCFSDDIAFGIAGASPTLGRDAVLERLGARASTDVVHHAFNIVVVEARPQETLVRADFTMARRGTPIATGRYADEVVSSAAGLRFRSRSIEFTWRAEA